MTKRCMDQDLTDELVIDVTYGAVFVQQVLSLCKTHP